MCLLSIALYASADTQTPYFRIWYGSDRPTFIYDSYVMSAGLLGDSESTIRAAITAGKLGWNVVAAQEAKYLDATQLQNSFALLSSIAEPQEHMPHQFPLQIPVVHLDLFFKNAQDPEIPARKVMEQACKYWNYRIIGVADCGYYPWNFLLEKNIRNIRFFSAWYPTVGANDYEPTGPNELMYCGIAWSAQQKDVQGRFQILWNKLDQLDYFVVYGHAPTWKHMKHYKGCIPMDGTSFVDTIHKHGMMLVMHSEHHLASGAPSGRIFEAAAAAAIIICDQHPFVKREFGDTVFYIDETKDTVFEQIEAHVTWIRANPEKAMNMARKAHTIFMEKFTLEQQLLALYDKVQQTNGLNPSKFTGYQNCIKDFVKYNCRRAYRAFKAWIQ